MITPLILKLQNCKENSELQQIYIEILSEYENINFPSANSKFLSKFLVTEPIETFINEFNSDILRKKNITLLDSIKLLDNM